jgi:hypothetical protein
MVFMAAECASHGTLACLHAFWPALGMTVPLGSAMTSSSSA